jgi:hypothetical protein
MSLMQWSENPAQFLDSVNLQILPTDLRQLLIVPTGPRPARERTLRLRAAVRKEVGATLRRPSDG